MNYHALCFVDMPFGQKSDLESGVAVDFDQIYNAKLVAASRGTRMVTLIESPGIPALKKPDSARNPLDICHATTAKERLTAGRSWWRRALPF
jgi:hypothetical protein